MVKEIILTQEGINELKTELKHLLYNIRPKVIEELVDARNQGDLSENADYDAARNRQAEVETKIKEIELMISKAKIIKSSLVNDGIVKVGASVTLKMLNTKKKCKVKIVGAVEADPFQNLISNESPVAKAILGKKVGEIVEVKEINNPYLIEIKKVN